MQYAAGLLMALLLFVGTASRLDAQTALFTYQGRLSDGAQPAHGNYDLQFRLADAAVGSNYLGPLLTCPSVTVSNGSFTVRLDFGAAVFDGAARWLEIGVRTNAGTGFAVLAPRQPITAMPYAIYSGQAASLSGTLPASQVNGVLSADQLPGFVVTNGPGGVTLSGTFTGKLIGSGAGLTNMAGTNLMSFSSTTTNFDNDTWLGWLSGNFNSYRNLNRFGTPNSFARLRQHQPLTVLFLGDGLVDEPPQDSLFENVLVSLTNAFGVAGYICSTGLGYDARLFEPVSAAFYGSDCTVGKTTDWLVGIYFTNNASGASYTLNQPLNADVFGVGWVSQPLGGSMVLWTNNGSSGWQTLTTLQGYSAGRVGHWLWWTNTTHAPGMQIKVLNSGNGTNLLVGVAFIDSSSSGIIPIRQTAQSSSVSDYRRCSEAVRTSIYQAWNPNLILTDYYIYTNGTPNANAAAMFSDFVATCDFLKTNTPTADVVLCSSFRTLGSASFDIPSWLRIAQTNDWVFFDGWDMMSDYYNLVARGLANADGGHLTTAGYQFYSQLLANYLALSSSVSVGSGNAVTYVSPELDFTVGSFTVSHHLGYVPRLVRVVLRCKANDAGSGMAVGEEVPIEFLQDTKNFSPAMSFKASSTSLCILNPYAVTGNELGVRIGPVGGGASPSSFNNFKLVIYATR
jgi:hypothetical protein